MDKIDEKFDAAFSKKDIISAIARVEEMIAEAPESAKGWICKGRLEMSRHNFAQAIVDFEKAASLDLDANICAGLGIAYYDGGLIDAAELNFNRGLLFDRRNSDLISGLAYVKLARNERVSAIRFALRSFVIKPSNGTLNALVHIIAVAVPALRVLLVVGGIATVFLSKSLALSTIGLLVAIAWPLISLVTYLASQDTETGRKTVYDIKIGIVCLSIGWLVIEFLRVRN